MCNVETESKGLVYEAFVNAALERLYPGRVRPHPFLPGVLADQDAAVEGSDGIEFVVGVTHWGSHETAKMKFWRIQEDVFEVHERYPRKPFVHVLFESPKDAT